MIFSSLGYVLGFVNNTTINNINSNNMGSHLNSNNTYQNINKTIYLDNLKGNDINPGSLNSPKKTLKNAVNAVTDNGLIIISHGQYGGEANTNILINKNIKIIGNKNGTIINAGNTQIFNITADISVSIEGINLINGNSNKGGAIINLGNLNVTDCIFNDNQAASGGAIYNKKNLNIINSKFIKNSASQGEGLGGAVYTRQGNCKINNSIFSDNNAIGDGGSINNNYMGNLIIENTKFIRNYARSAGAISNSKDCKILNCNFKNNTADRMGGAIYTMGNLNIDHTIFEENSALYDVGGAIGNAVIADTTNIMISNSDFNKNHAKNNGAISNVGYCDINNSKFNENLADEDGGVIGNTGNLDVINSNFTHNQADRYGGVIISANIGLINIEKNNFTFNKANICGGVIVAVGPSNIIQNQFLNNTALEGGALYNNFRGDAQHPKAIIQNNNFTKNTAKTAAGAIANTGAGILTKNNFIMNQITNEGYGGAIINVNGTLYLDGENEFFHNVINNSITNSGGGIANIDDGHVFVRGYGNIFTDSNILNKGYLNLKDCEIQKNTEDGNYLDNDNSKGFSSFNFNIVNSEHPYQTITQKDYRTTDRGVPTHIDHINNITIKKGSISSQKTSNLLVLNPQLWVSGVWPWDYRVSNEILKINIYNKNGTCLSKSPRTSWRGWAKVVLDISNLAPGDYYILVSYDGEKPYTKNIKNPMYLSCVRCVSLTITS